MGRGRNPPDRASSHALSSIVAFGFSSNELHCNEPAVRPMLAFRVANLSVRDPTAFWERLESDVDGFALAASADDGLIGPAFS